MSWYLSRRHVINPLFPRQMADVRQLKYISFNEYISPMNTHTSHSHQIPSRQSQSYKFSKIAKKSNFEILQPTLRATHLLKLFDKMYKYEMDPTRTVGAT